MTDPVWFLRDRARYGSGIKLHRFTGLFSRVNETS